MGAAHVVLSTVVKIVIVSFALIRFAFSESAPITKSPPDSPTIKVVVAQLTVLLN